VELEGKKKDEAVKENKDELESDSVVVDRGEGEEMSFEFDEERRAAS
jgi:hypothetical protein